MDGDSIELDEFESFRTQAFSGGKQRVGMSKSLPGGSRPVMKRPPNMERRIQSARTSQMELLIREELTKGSIEELAEDGDSSGSVAEEDKLIKRGAKAANHSSNPGLAGSKSRLDRIAATSPKPAHRQPGSGPSSRLGRSYSCKPRTRHRQSIGGGPKEGARPRAGSATTLSKTPVCRHSSLTTGIFEYGDIEIYRVRSFTTTNKGIVKHGDSFKIRSSPMHKKALLQEMDAAEELQTVQKSDHDEDQPEEDDTVGPEALAVELPPDDTPTLYRVLISGSAGVGKSTLNQQFLTSDYLGNREVAEDATESRVTVVLDNEEAVVEFLDNASAETVPCLHKQFIGFTRIIVWEDKELTEKAYEPSSIDAHLVVFSVVDRGSFRIAEARLREIKSQEYDSRKSTTRILVANKQDLVRNRSVTEDEGVSIATKYGIKYTEVSAILNHKVDELLVGTIRQIRLRPDGPGEADGGGEGAGDREAGAGRKAADDRDNSCLPRAVVLFFRRLFRKQDDSTKSCENLLVV